MIVAFAAAAEAELQEIEGYLAQDDPIAARRFVDDLIAACMSLKGAYNRGYLIATVKRVPVRRLVHHPYLIVYSVMAGVVRIHRIRHGARSPKLLLKGLDLT